MKEKILFSWSGGKDSAFALYEIKRKGNYEIASLLTTITEDYGRVSMHGVRRSLLKRQAAALRLPLYEIFLTRNANNDEYEDKMREALIKFGSFAFRVKISLDSTIHNADVFLT